MVGINETEAMGASRCPVCQKSPTLTVEPAVWPTLRKTQDFVLRCQMGHPYIAMGDNFQMAVQNWNIYIDGRMKESQRARMTMITDTMLSHCKNCLTYTPSIVRFDGRDSSEQCAKCFLIKAVKECE